MSIRPVKMLQRTRNLILYGLGICALVRSVAGAEFYVDSKNGDDSQDGRSPADAWRTLSQASRAELKPGDRLLLRGGQSFEGSLRLGPEDSGAPAHPVTIGSYGAGRATIQAGTGYGILVSNAGWVEVRDVICVGADRRTNHGAGVAFVNSLPGSKRLQHIRVENVEARGFGRELPKPGTLPEGFQLPQGAGVLIAGNASDGSKSGFEDVEISGCTCHDNAYYGILVTGYWNEKATTYANANVHISQCRVFENPGDPLYHENHSGSGILVEDCDGGVVEKCVAWENGRLCNYASGGPCGIWTAIARRVIIQECESYRNQTSAVDGDGFDLDGGCISCVLQYNYSHENDGAGFLVYTYAGAPHADRGNVVRWNVSENDAVRIHRYGGICLGNSGKDMTGVQVYNNTIVVSRTNELPDCLVAIQDKNIEASFWNNLLIGQPGVPLVRMAEDHPGIVFHGNGYCTNDGLVAQIGEQVVHDLGAWRKLGKETLQGMATGVLLPNWIGNQGLDLATQPAMLERLRPVKWHDGVDLQKLFEIAPGPRDFSGAKLKGGNGLPIGSIASSEPR